jgi:hypothetical protein
MNAFDREFWNGCLKTAILIEHDLKKLSEKAPDEHKEGLEVAIRRINEIKTSIEVLNGNSVMKRLKEIENED